MSPQKKPTWLKLGSSFFAGTLALGFLAYGLLQLPALYREALGAQSKFEAHILRQREVAEELISALEVVESPGQRRDIMRPLEDYIKNPRPNGVDLGPIQSVLKQQEEGQGLGAKLSPEAQVLLRRFADGYHELVKAQVVRAKKAKVFNEALHWFPYQLLNSLFYGYKPVPYNNHHNQQVETGN